MDKYSLTLVKDLALVKKASIVGKVEFECGEVWLNDTTGRVKLLNMPISADAFVEVRGVLERQGLFNCEEYTQFHSEEFDMTDYVSAFAYYLQFSNVLAGED